MKSRMDGQGDESDEEQRDGDELMREKERGFNIKCTAWRIDGGVGKKRGRGGCERLQRV